MPRESRSAGRLPKILMVGYNGANNTGAEALLLADIQDLRAVLGPGADITVPTLNERNLRRYLSEGPHLRIAPVPSIYFAAVRRLVRSHDITLLVEGSSYMDTWSSALLWAFLWATRCSRDFAKPSLAYAVDAGEMRSRLNRRLTRIEASKTDLIVARSAAAAERLRAWGVAAPIETTADNAFTFQPEPADQGWPERAWPEAGPGWIGFAAVDFHLWPVRIRPWGRQADCYRWPYYFTRSAARRRLSADLAAGYARLADECVTRHNRPVALLCMEQLDEALARAIRGRMQHPDRARVFSAREYNASQMTVLLRRLDLLVTSRYHASVLSLAAAVPQLAVGHDLRLQSIYQELGLCDECFFAPDTPGLFRRLAERIRETLADPGPLRERLKAGHNRHLAAARRNRGLLRKFLQDRGWPVMR